jgi:protease-4
MTDVIQESAANAASYRHPQKKRKSRWWIPVVIILSVFVFGFFIVAVGLFALFGSAFKSKPVVVKPHSVLRLHVQGPLEEYASPGPFSFLDSNTDGDVNFLQAITAIKRAKDDDHIAGAYYHSGDIWAGFAKAIELKEALVEFKKAGKFIHAFLEFGSELDYFFASLADSIYMPAEGIAQLNGFGVSELFLKGTYDKIGFDFHVEQFEEYKSAGETYNRKKFSDPARRNIEEIMWQRFATYTNTIAENRNLPVDRVSTLIRKGLYSADELLEHGFIDNILPEGEVHERIKKAVYGDSVNVADEKLNTISLAKYAQSDSYKRSGKPATSAQIAIILGSGMIVPGETGDVSPFSEPLIGSTTFSRYLKKAREDKKTDAVILRIDSPGGSVLAADAIWEEIKKTAEVKPVYATMSDVAASGGYYIAMACDTIIAHPQTITGSIGVISIIPNFAKALDKIGASVDTISTGKSAFFLHPYLPLIDEDKLKFHALSERVYHRFVEKVAQARNMPFEKARELARGRVWIGEDALKVGLVDTLGGFQTAINIVKRRLGVPEDAKVRVRFYPEPRDSFSAFINFLRYFTESRLNPKSKETPVSTTAVSAILPRELQAQIDYLYALYRLSLNERILVALPYKLNIE